MNKGTLNQLFFTTVDRHAGLPFAFRSKVGGEWIPITHRASFRRYLLDRLALIGEGRACKTVRGAVDQRVGNRPRVSDGYAPRVVPQRQGRRVGETLDVVTEIQITVRRTIDGVGDMIVLVVTPHEQCLVFAQVEIQPRDESVQSRRCARIEAEAARV